MRACPTAVETKCTKRRVERARVEVRAGLLLMPKVLTSLSDRGRCNCNNNNNSNNIMPLISAGYTDLSPPTAPKTAQDAYPRFLAIRRQFDDNFVSILRSLLPSVASLSSLIDPAPSIEVSAPIFNLCHDFSVAGRVISLHEIGGSVRGIVSRRKKRAEYRNREGKKGT